jgi:hypothetical protein
MKAKRPYIFGLVLAAVVLGPYWLYLPLVLASLILIPLWWEGIFFGFLIDTLYGTGMLWWIKSPFPFALFATLVLVISIPIRDQLRLN